MRIGICGTHCAGKTTLAKALSEKYGWPTILDVAASMPCETITDQLAIMSEQIGNEIFMVDRYGGFISDRTVLDNWAYITRLYKDNESLCEMATYLKLYHLRCMPYDMIIFVNECFPIEDNGHRSTDVALQTYIFNLLTQDIRFVAMEDNIPVCVVKGSTEERIKQIETWSHEIGRPIQSSHRQVV